MNHEQLPFPEPEEGNVIDLDAARQEREKLNSTVAPLGGAAIFNFPEQDVPEYDRLLDREPADPYADLGYRRDVMNGPRRHPSDEVLLTAERQQLVEDVKEQIGAIREKAHTPPAKLFCRGLEVLTEIADVDYDGDIESFTTQQYGRNAGNGNKQERQYRALRDGMALKTVSEAMEVAGVHKDEAEHPWRTHGFVKDNLRVRVSDKETQDRLEDAVRSGLNTARDLIGTFGVNSKGAYVVALRMEALRSSRVVNENKQAPTKSERRRALARFLLEDDVPQDTIPPNIA